MDVRVVKRGEYDEEVVRWADAIVSAGGTQGGSAAARLLSWLRCVHWVEETIASDTSAGTRRFPGDVSPLMRLSEKVALAAPHPASTQP